MTEETSLNNIIQSYKILNTLSTESQHWPPIHVPDELTASEYYHLSDHYARYHLVHHALECLRRADDLDSNFKTYTDIRRKLLLPSAIPPVEAVEQDLLARNQFKWFLGRDYEDTSQVDSAYQSAQACVANFPDYSYGYLTLGALEEIRRNYSASIAAFEKVLELSPENVEAMNSIGSIYLKRLKLLKARKWFMETLKHDPNNQSAHGQIHNISGFLRNPIYLLSLKFNLFGAVYRWFAIVAIKLTMLRLRKRYQNDPKAFKPNVGGFLDKSGDVVVEIENVRPNSKFSCGLYCSQGVSSAKFLDRNGINVFAREFRWAEDFSEDLASVFDDGKWGFIDLQGDHVVKPTFEDVGPFRSGRAPAKSNSSWGFINKAGDWIVEPKFENVLPFSEERAAVSRNGKIAFIDLLGKEITDYEFDEVAEFANGRAKTVRYETEIERHKITYIDIYGQTAIDLNAVHQQIFDDPIIAHGRLINDFFRDTDQYLYAGEKTSRRALTSRNRRYEYGNRSHQFSEGLLVIRAGPRCGYINLEGELVIPINFFYGRAFSDGLALLSLEEFSEESNSLKRPNARQWVFINKIGEVHIALEPTLSVRSFSDGLAFITTADNEKFFIDCTGPKVIKLGNVSRFVGDFHHGLAPIETPLDYFL